MRGRIANIGPRQRRRRLRFGIAAFVLGLALAGVLIGLDASRWLRLVVLPPFWAGALGYLQAREKT